MDVLSLFDGMSSGQIALERMGIKVDNYFASEIDQNAIKVTMKNYPNTIQLGDVTKWKDWDLPNLDLIMGGSPCQGFSFSGKCLNFEDPRSKLLFEFVDIVNHCKSKYFLLENVKMKKEHQDIISDYLGVQPIEINSALVSAQNRVRLYWTNIPDIEQPKDKEINLINILESKDMTNPAAIRGRKLYKDKSTTQCLEVRDKYTNKSNCLTTVAKDNVLTNLPPGRYIDVFNKNYPFKYYTVKEYCRLQTIPEDYVNVVSESQARKMLGNGWTVDVISHILSFIK